MIGLAVFFLIMIPINSKMSHKSSNINLKGEKLIPDHIKLAKFLKQDYDKVYAFNLDEYYFFGTLNCDYEKYFKSPVLEENTEDKKNVSESTADRSAIADHICFFGISYQYL